MDDILKSMFGEDLGEGFGRGGADLRAEISVSFEEAAFGCEFLFRPGVTCAGIRVVFFRQLPICFLYGLVVRAALHS